MRMGFMRKTVCKREKYNRNKTLLLILLLFVEYYKCCTEMKHVLCKSVLMKKLLYINYSVMVEQKLVRVWHGVRLKWLEVSTSKHDGLMELGISLVKALKEEHKKELLVSAKPEWGLTRKKGKKLNSGGRKGQNTKVRVLCGIKYREGKTKIYGGTCIKCRRHEDC